MVRLDREPTVSKIKGGKAMKRKLLSVALAAILTASLAACGGGGSESSTPAESAAPASEEAAADTGEAADSGEAAATDISGSTIEVAVTYTGDQSTVFNETV